MVIRPDVYKRQWLDLGRELGDDVMLLNAVPWVIDSFTWVRAPEPEDFELIVEALGVDVWSLDLSGRRRLSLRRSWRDLDAPGLRAWLLANLAGDWAFGLPLQTIADELPGDAPLALADEACRAAGQSADSESADEALFWRCMTLVGTPDAEAQLADAKRVSAMNFAVFGAGRLIGGIAFARLGRLDDMGEWTAETLLLAERSGDRLLRSNGLAQQALEALARGRPEDARRAVEQAVQAAPQEPAVQLSAAMFAVAELLAAGQPNEARPLAELLDSTPLYDLSHLVGAVAAAQGDTDTARAVLDAWKEAGHPLVADLMHSARLWAYAECAHAVGDQDAARLLYGELLPYDGQLLLCAWCFVTSSAAFSLGRLAGTLGDDDRARPHYTEALTFEESCGAEMLAARTRRSLTRLS